MCCCSFCFPPFSSLLFLARKEGEELCCGERSPRGNFSPPPPPLSSFPALRGGKKVFWALRGRKGWSGAEEGSLCSRINTRRSKTRTPLVSLHFRKSSVQPALLLLRNRIICRRRWGEAFTRKDAIAGNKLAKCLSGERRDTFAKGEGKGKPLPCESITLFHDDVIETGSSD